MFELEALTSLLSPSGEDEMSNSASKAWISLFTTKCLEGDPVFILLGGKYMSKGSYDDGETSAILTAYFGY